MEQEDYDHYHTMLAERTPNARCPMCGSAEWERTATIEVSLHERHLGAGPPSDDAAGITEHRRPAIALACEQCHFLRVHLTTSPYAYTDG